MWRVSPLHAAATQQTRKMSNLVSLRYAPSFKQPPAQEVIAKPVKQIPANWVTAYVIPQAVSQKQQQALLQFVQPWFARLPYNDGHLDGLIHHYKQFYRSYNEIMQVVSNNTNHLSDSHTRESLQQKQKQLPCNENHYHQQKKQDINSSKMPSLQYQQECVSIKPIRKISASLRVNARVQTENVNNKLFDQPVTFSTQTNELVRTALTHIRGLATHYLPHIPIDDRVHFLRLSGSGFIRAHVDETRNSSGIIGGVCLRSGRVMTLTHPRFPSEKVELMLAPRCFYAIIGSARYTWQHSVDWVKDDDEHIKRIRGSLVVQGTPVIFDGHETAYRRFDRSVIIFRGVSPMHLFAQRVLQPHHSNPFS